MRDAYNELLKICPIASEYYECKKHEKYYLKIFGKKQDEIDNFVKGMNPL